MQIHGTAIQEFDEVRLTGICCSWTGGPKRLENVTGTVGTVSTHEPPAIKVWPFEDMDNGKLWFEVAGIECIEVLARL